MGNKIDSYVTGGRPTYKRSQAIEERGHRRHL